LLIRLQVGLFTRCPTSFAVAEHLIFLYLLFMCWI